MPRGKRRAVPTAPPKHLSIDMVLLVHEHLVEAFAEDNDPISPPGVRDMGLLDSAVHRQSTGAGDYLKYRSPCANAASLMYGVCNNHPFHNGNKRTALVSALMHLDANGLVLDGVTRDELYRLMLGIASHTIVRPRSAKKVRRSRPNPDQEVDEITKWLEARARRIKRGERSITYGQLYRILQNFGYELGQKRHNRIEILKRRWSFFGGKKVCVHKVSCPGDSRKVNLDEIKQVRAALELSERDGVDSESFYDTQSRVDAFIRHHRGVLRRLARV